MVWNSDRSSDKSALERVQKKFLRFLYFKENGTYPHYQLHPVRSVDLQRRFDLENLERRRYLLDILFLRKLVTGELDFPYGLSTLNFNTSSAHLRRLFDTPFNEGVCEDSAPLFRCITAGEEVSSRLDLFADSSTIIRKCI